MVLLARMTLLALHLVLLIAVHAKNDLKPERTLAKWFEAIKTFDGFVQAKTEVLVDEAEEDSGKTRKTKFVRIADIAEGKFDGNVDEDGMPNGFGKLFYKKGAEECSLRTLMDFTRSIEATFSHGVIEGNARFHFINGSELFASIDKGVLDGFTVQISVPKMSGVQVLDGTVTAEVNQMKPSGLRSGARWTWYEQLQVAGYQEASQTQQVFIYLGKEECNPIMVDVNEEVSKDNFVTGQSLKDVSLEEVKGFHELHPGDVISSLKLRVPQSYRMADEPARRDLLMLAFVMTCKKALKNSVYSNIVKNKTLLETEYKIAEKDKASFGYLIETESNVREIQKARLSDDPVCKETLKFIEWPHPESLHQVMFMCYPGSGSKWILAILEQSLGFGTKSNCYFGVQTNFKQGISGAVIKSHYIRYSFKKKIPESLIVSRVIKHFTFTNGRVILLIRNPFEAILSYLNHILSDDVFFNSSINVSHMVNYIQDSGEFEHYARHEIHLWESMIMDFITLAPDLLVIHYEKFKEDFVRVLEKVHHFLKAPIDQNRIDCLKKHPIGNHRRQKMDLPIDPFSKEIRKKIMKSIEKVDKTLKEFGHEPIPWKMYKYI